MDEFETVYLQNNKFNTQNTLNAAERLKIGEVFQIRQNQFVFVCIHCSKEFHHFARFTVHVQSHFQAVFQWSHMKNEPAETSATSMENEEWLMSDTSNDTSNYDNDGNDEPMADFQCETYVHEESNDVFNVSPTNSEISQPLEKQFKLKHPLIQIDDNDEARRLLPYFSKKCLYQTTADQRFKCPLCEYIGANKAIVREHIFMHADTKFLVCRLCQEKFYRPRQVREHVESKHCDFTISPARVPKKPKTNCGENVRESNSLSKNIKLDPDLLRSLAERNSDDRLRCYICQKTFSKANGIVKHMKVHSQERSHQCATCGAQFIRSDHLNRHLLCHEPPKFKCDICEVAFRRSDKLLAHRRKHSEPMNFTCEDCGLGFMELSSIKTHLGFHCKGKGESKAATTTTTELAIENTGSGSQEATERQANRIDPASEDIQPGKS